MVDSIGPKAIVNYWVAIAHINLLSALNTPTENPFRFVSFTDICIYFCLLFVFHSIRYAY